MILSGPTKFLEAIAMLAESGLLPTSLGTRDIDRLDASIRRHAIFSAKVTDARFLQEVADIIRRIVEPEQRPGAYTSKPRARDLLREFIQQIGYEPEEGTEGTLQDLSSDVRIDLIVRMNTEMTQGYGQHVQANDPVVLDAFPCQELFRLQRVEEPRHSNALNQFTAKTGYGGLYWPNRWREFGGRFYGGGRMIARKDDAVWTGISRFGNPYPPFDYNSGMWLKPVPRWEAEQLGVIAKGDKVARSEVAFEQPMQTGIKSISPTVLAALQRAIPGASIKDGILTQEDTTP